MTPDTPDISIVTPSFNQGRFIEAALESVHQEKNSGIEIEHIVFDACSSDETVSILDRWSGRARWVSEPDRGQAHAVNKGILAARGPIIGWLNSDDIYYPGALPAVLAVFRENPQIDVVYGLADHVDVFGVPFEAYPTEPWDFSTFRDVLHLPASGLHAQKRARSTWLAR